MKNYPVEKGLNSSSFHFWSTELGLQMSSQEGKEMYLLTAFCVPSSVLGIVYIISLNSHNIPVW